MLWQLRYDSGAVTAKNYGPVSYLQAGANENLVKLKRAMAIDYLADFFSKCLTLDNLDFLCKIGP